MLLFVVNFYRESKIPGNRLKNVVDSTFAAHPETVGIMVSLVSKGKAWNYAAGIADKATNETLKPDQPVLIASNTKTYVAAAILRLCGQQKMDLYDTIGRYVTHTTLMKLLERGYQTDKITVAHLLSHTSGIEDYVNDAYFDLVNSNKLYKWTRTGQLDRAWQSGGPIAAPGDTFKYADVNYLLLSEMLETVTHQPFFKAIRQLLKYDDLNLKQTWFVELEPRPLHTAPFAHQYWNKYPWDSYELDPSWDLYGGGGIAATPADLALFFYDLFEGKIIKDPKLLAQLYTGIPSKTKTNYCLGIRKLNIGGLTGYYHGGFWGTDAIYFPELKTSIAIVVLEKSSRDISADICNRLVALLKDAQIVHQKTDNHIR